MMRGLHEERIDAGVGSKEADLAVPYIRVFAGIGSQDAPQGSPPASVHDRVSRKGAMQILLYLYVPVLGMVFADLQAQNEDFSIFWVQLQGETLWPCTSQHSERRACEAFIGFSILSGGALQANQDSV